VAALRAWRARQAAERLAVGAGYRDGDLVFCRPDGMPLHPKGFSAMFERAVKGSGLPRVRLHDLRHTWATLALAAGVPAKVVSERLGHVTIAMTMNVYSHVLPGMQADAAEKVAALIFGGQ
jgi:integrase